MSGRFWVQHVKLLPKFLFLGCQIFTFSAFLAPPPGSGLLLVRPQGLCPYGTAVCAASVFSLQPVPDQCPFNQVLGLLLFTDDQVQPPLQAVRCVNAVSWSPLNTFGTKRNQRVTRCA